MPLPDSLDFPLADPLGRELHDKLARLMGRKAELMARTAGLDTSDIPMPASPRQAWTSVLDTAWITGSLPALFAAIEADRDSATFRPQLGQFLARWAPPPGPPGPAGPDGPPEVQPAARATAAEGPVTAAEAPVTAAPGSLVHALAGHTHWLKDLAFSPDGQRLASAGDDRQLLLWDVDAGELYRSLPGHAGPVHAVAYSPCGELLASAGEDGVVRLWSADGALLHELPEHDGPVRAVTFSPAGGLLATAGADRVVRLWDVATRKTLHELSEHTSDVYGVAFSPDGAQLASAGADRTVRLWDVPAGSLRYSLNGHAGRVSCAVFSPAEQLLVSVDCLDESLRAWNPETGNEIHVPRTDAHGIRDVEFSQDGALIAGLGDGRIEFRRTLGSPMRAVDAHQGAVSCLAYSPGRRLLASGGGRDHLVKIWSEVIPAR
ncbi:MAG TPA: WD40 repeat domain-containing protein [Trebonia sp.]|jgi:WD40 repeat protein|nr:WD40 repeat domain-containing protein [Trebonia sp.]